MAGLENATGPRILGGPLILEQRRNFLKKNTDNIIDIILSSNNNLKGS